MVARGDRAPQGITGARKSAAYIISMKHELQFKSFSKISDNELLRRLSELLQKSRRVESELVAHIGEVDARRLYAREAAPSMFAYCTEVLNLSEHEAYLRIAVARASRKHPMLLEMLGEGRLHLSAIGKLAPYLTEANRETLLARAAGKSKRKIEELVAELSPKPDVPGPCASSPRGGKKRNGRRFPNSVRTELRCRCPQDRSQEVKPLVVPDSGFGGQRPRVDGPSLCGTLRTSWPH